RPEERPAPVTADIDTSNIQLAPIVFVAADRESAEQRRAAIAAPALSLAPAAGELLRPEEKRRQTPPLPTPDLTLAEPGAPLETLPTARAPVTPNLDGLEVAPAGSALLADAEKPQRPAPLTPDISHLQLRD